MEKSSVIVMDEILAPDDPENPFSDANELIFVGEEGWSHAKPTNSRPDFGFIRDGARWEVHYEVGEGDEKMSPESAERTEDFWSEFEYCIALNERQVVGGGWVSSVDYIQYEGEEQDVLSLGVEDTVIHNAPTIEVEDSTR